MIGDTKLVTPQTIEDPNWKFTAIPGDAIVYIVDAPLSTDEFTINCEQNPVDNGDIYIRFKTGFNGLTLNPGENVKFSQPKRMGQNSEGVIRLLNLADIKEPFYMVE